MYYSITSKPDQKINSIWKCTEYLKCCLQFSNPHCSPLLISTMNMEATCSPETFVLINQAATQCHNQKNTTWALLLWVPQILYCNLLLPAVVLCIYITHIHPYTVYILVHALVSHMLQSTTCKWRLLDWGVLQHQPQVALNKCAMKSK